MPLLQHREPRLLPHLHLSSRLADRYMNGKAVGVDRISLDSVKKFSTFKRIPLPFGLPVLARGSQGGRPTCDRGYPLVSKVFHLQKDSPQCNAGAAEADGAVSWNAKQGRLPRFL